MSGNYPDGMNQYMFDEYWADKLDDDRPLTSWNYRTLLNISRKPKLPCHVPNCKSPECDRWHPGDDE